MNAPLWKNVVAAWLLGASLPAAAAELVAHEWGTFTSVQGSDGQLVPWNPFNSTDLPAFVYERNQQLTDPAVLLSKNVNAWLQRMETPVIYFYSDHNLTVDVTVELPDGLLTEWYPQVHHFTPRGKVTDKSSLHWANLQIHPGVPPAVAAAQLPAGDGKSHYFAARETDSALVRATVKKNESEKFLFYRGVANFASPLFVAFDGENGGLRVANNGQETLEHVFVLRVSGGRARFARIESLEPQEVISAPDAMVHHGGKIADVANVLGPEMEASLISSGLYPAEAAAMVKTWRDSWFTEEGTRILYLLPRAWTDRVLPLAIQPAPTELIRVMVGRAEVFSPTLEAELQTGLAQFHQQGVVGLRRGIKGVRLGRFAEPAMTRLKNLEIRETERRVGSFAAAWLKEHPVKP